MISMECNCDVLTFVRRNGRADAPVVFLTIEDGGDFQTSDEIISFYSDSRNQLWHRSTEGHDPKKLNNKPDRCISKIMAEIILGSLNRWRDYRDNELYFCNECNIKYRPIAKKSDKQWPHYYQAALGSLTFTQYLNKCNSHERWNAIYMNNKSAFIPSKVFIILGLQQEWSRFLNQYVYTSEVVHPRRLERKDTRGHILYELYCNENNENRYYYFNAFRPGLKDDDIKEFCSTIRPVLPPFLDFKIRKELTKD